MLPKTRLLLAFSLLVGGLAVISGGPASAQEPSVWCTSSMEQDGSVRFNAGAEGGDAIIERTRDGSQWWWRGRTTNDVFLDTVTSGSIYEYRAKGLGANTSTEPCGRVDLSDGPIPARAGCTVTQSSLPPTADGVRITVEFEGLADSLLKKHVFYRSIDGGPFYWRGVDAFYAPSFTDTVPYGVDVTYRALAVRADNRRSELSECGTFRKELDSPSTPVCGAAAFVERVVHARGESWSHAAIYRSTDGGPAYWRGRFEDGFTNNFNFRFVDNTMEVGKVYDYWMEAVGFNGERTERVYCGQMDANIGF